MGAAEAAPEIIRLKAMARAAVCFACIFHFFRFINSLPEAAVIPERLYLLSILWRKAVRLRRTLFIILHFSLWHNQRELENYYNFISFLFQPRAAPVCSRRQDKKNGGFPISRKTSLSKASCLLHTDATDISFSDQPDSLKISRLEPRQRRFCSPSVPLYSSYMRL